MSIRQLYLKYFQAPIRTLNYIDRATRNKNYVMFSEIQAHLKRNKNQVSRVIGTLAEEGLIVKERKSRHIIVSLTKLGSELLQKIRDELSFK